MYAEIREEQRKQREAAREAERARRQQEREAEKAKREEERAIAKAKQEASRAEAKAKQEAERAQATETQAASTTAVATTLTVAGVDGDGGVDDGADDDSEPEDPDLAEEAEAKDSAFTETVKQIREEHGAVCFRALSPGLIREGVDMESSKVGKLVVGEVFDVLEEKWVSGQHRVRMDRGWVVFRKKGF